MKTLKSLATLLLCSLLFVGCSATGGGENTDTNGLVLSVNKPYIYDNGGVDENGIAVFTLTFNGKVVSNNYTIYEGEDTPLEGNTFTSTECGTYKFWAVYNNVNYSSTISINVLPTPPPAPAVPTDNNPTKLDFARRVLLLQFTGTGCQYCPLMVNALYDLQNNKDYTDKIAIAAAHIGGFAGNDPALLEDAPTLDDAFGISRYPSINIDMVKNTTNGNANAAYLAQMVTKALERVAVKGGIAVNAKYYPDDSYIVINTLVKAKTTDEFRIGAWLLEDNIYGAQSINSSIERNPNINYNYHNNCVRRANSKQTNTDFTGYSLGTIKAGETASEEFAFQILKNWKAENMRILVFISTKEGKNWHINNAVIASIDGATDFEYAK